MNLQKLAAVGSGYRSYAAGWSLVAVGALGTMPPAYQVVFGPAVMFGDFGLTPEMLAIIQQIAVSLGGLAVIFIRAAISKISPMLADAAMPLIQAAIDKAISAAMEKLKPQPNPDDQIIITAPVKLED